MEIWKDILYVVGIILGVVVAFVVTRYLVPWLKTKLGESKFLYIMQQVQAFMTAIEERAGYLPGEEKAEWVTDRVIEMFPKLEHEYVRALIDGSMQALTLDGLINYHKVKASNEDDVA